MSDPLTIPLNDEGMDSTIAEPRAVEPEPMFTVSIDLQLPRRLVLPVEVNAAGERVPATGFVWQKYLDHALLTQLGVRVEWRDRDGVLYADELASSLIQREAERQALAHAVLNQQVGTGS